MKTPSFEPELLSAYLDNEVTPEERLRVEAAIRNSPAAAAELAALRDIAARVCSMPREAAPFDFAAEYLSKGDQPIAPPRANHRFIGREPGIIRIHRATLAISSAALVALSTMAGWMAHRAARLTPSDAPAVALNFPASPAPLPPPARESTGGSAPIAQADRTRTEALSSESTPKRKSETDNAADAAQSEAAVALSKPQPIADDAGANSAAIGDTQIVAHEPSASPVASDAPSDIADDIDLSIDVIDKNASPRRMTDVLFRYLSAGYPRPSEAARDASSVGSAAEGVIEVDRERLSRALALIAADPSRGANVRISGDYALLSELMPTAATLAYADPPKSPDVRTDDASADTPIAMDADDERMFAVRHKTTGSREIATPPAAPPVNAAPLAPPPGRASRPAAERRPTTRETSIFVDPAIAEELEFLRIIEEMKRGNADSASQPERPNTETKLPAVSQSTTGNGRAASTASKAPSGVQNAAPGGVASQPIEPPPGGQTAATAAQPTPPPASQPAARTYRVRVRHVPSASPR
ncbi:MAG: zf-HC2 domain-containing protein [Phycisphaerae bacterium]|nr:zf-HC2 domain-containing protein [Phycisphaerae bacterium]